MQSMLLWGRLTTVRSVACPATSHTATPARSPSQVDQAAREKAWWEPGQGAMCTAVSREGLPRAKATTEPL
jgi:hypothetical protein